MRMMQSRPLERGLIVAAGAFAATWLAAGPAAGQDLEGKATMAAPNRVVVNTMAMSPSSAGLSTEACNAYGNICWRRRSRGRASWRRPRPVSPTMAAPSPQTQTTVSGDPNVPPDPFIPAATASVLLDHQHMLTAAETQNFTSHVSEPSFAVTKNGARLVTANWFAAASTTSWDSFSTINPFTTFPNDPAGRGFCCDQVVIYDPGHDLMMWYLQYINDDAGNTGRLVVATGDDLKAQRWFYYDFTQAPLGAQFNRKWFDYPDLAVGENYLYITTNVFGTRSNDPTLRADPAGAPRGPLGQAGVRLQLFQHDGRAEPPPDPGGDGHDALRLAGDGGVDQGL